MLVSCPEMTWLAIHPEREPWRRVRDATDADTIGRELAAVGIRFERWAPATESFDALCAQALSKRFASERA